MNDGPDRTAMDAADAGAPSASRTYHYAVAGKNHFDADRTTADKIMGMSADAARIGYDNRAFLYRAVRLAARRGVRQFLDIGAGFPLPSGNTHQWAVGFNPAARIVYADSNPSAITHLRAQVQVHPQVMAVHGDLRKPRDILTSPILANCIDLGQPAAVILGAVLHFVPDDEAFDAVEYIKGGLAPGSYLIISHATGESANPGQLQEIRDRYSQMKSPLYPRTSDEVAPFFDGFRIEEPGIVNVNEWQNPVEMKTEVILYGGVGRKEAGR
jgi:hypothetical protein